MEEKEEIEVQLFCSSNEYEITQICAMLEENDIPYIRKDDGSGSYMNLYMGQSIQEKRIYVNEKDYAKSLELISSFLSCSIENEEELTEEQEENNNSGKKYTIIRRTLGILILGMPILVIILLIIMPFFNI